MDKTKDPTGNGWERKGVLLYYCTHEPMYTSKALRTYCCMNEYVRAHARCIRKAVG